MEVLYANCNTAQCLCLASASTASLRRPSVFLYGSSFCAAATKDCVDGHDVVQQKNNFVLLIQMQNRQGVS